MQEQLAPFLQMTRWQEEQEKLIHALRPPAELTQAYEMLSKPAAGMAKWLEDERKAAERMQAVLGNSTINDVLESASKAREAFDFSPPAAEFIRPIELPPSPLLETNERLQAVEEHAAGTRAAVSELGKMVSHLGVLGANMQAEGEKVNKRSLRVAYLSTAAAIVAVLLAGAQVWVQFSDTLGRARLESRIDELQAAQARSAEDAAKLRTENARLTAEIKALQESRSAPRTASRSR